jgi:hypothetical protein
MTNLTQHEKIEIIAANNSSEEVSNSIQHKACRIEKEILGLVLQAQPLKLAEDIEEIVGDEIQSEVPAHVIEFGVIFAYSSKSSVVASVDAGMTLQKAQPQLMKEFLDKLGQGVNQDHQAPLEERAQAIAKAAEFSRKEGEDVHKLVIECLEASARHDRDLRMLNAALYGLIVDVEYDKLMPSETHENASEFMS